MLRKPMLPTFKAGFLWFKQRIRRFQFSGVLSSYHILQTSRSMHFGSSMPPYLSSAAGSPLALAASVLCSLFEHFHSRNKAGVTRQVALTDDIGPNFSYVALRAFYQMQILLARFNSWHAQSKIFWWWCWISQFFSTTGKDGYWMNNSTRT